MFQSVMCGAISIKKKIAREDWYDFIETFDENNDKKIDFEEFKKMMFGFHDYLEKEKKYLTQSSQSKKSSKILMEKKVLNRNLKTFEMSSNHNSIEMKVDNDHCNIYRSFNFEDKKSSFKSKDDSINF